MPVSKVMSLSRTFSLVLASFLFLSTVSPCQAEAQKKPKYDAKGVKISWDLGMQLEKAGNFTRAVDAYAKAATLAIAAGKDNKLAMSTVDNLIGKFVALEARGFSASDMKTAAEAGKQKLKLIEFKEGKESEAYKKAAARVKRYEGTK
jgi:hypothetical protein